MKKEKKRKKKIAISLFVRHHKFRVSPKKSRGFSPTAFFHTGVANVLQMTVQSNRKRKQTIRVAEFRYGTVSGGDNLLTGPPQLPNTTLLLSPSPKSLSPYNQAGGGGSLPPPAEIKSVYCLLTSIPPSESD